MFEKPRLPQSTINGVQNHEDKENQAKYGGGPNSGWWRQDGGKGIIWSSEDWSCKPKADVLYKFDQNLSLEAPSTDF